MLSVALGENWKRSEYEKVFEEGFAFEPTYYHLQRAKIIYLLPQWNGEEGDLAKFITDNSNRLGGDEGEIMYFILTACLQPQYFSDTFKRTGLSWAKAKSGYEKLKKTYTVDSYRRNQFAYLAYYGLDMDAATPVLEEIGDDWHQDVWGTRYKFDQVRSLTKTWSELKAGKISISDAIRRNK